MDSSTSLTVRFFFPVLVKYDDNARTKRAEGNEEEREGQLLVARRAHMSPPPRVAISSPPQKVDAIALTSSRGITRVSPLCRKPAVVLRETKEG